MPAITALALVSSPIVTILLGAIIGAGSVLMTREILKRRAQRKPEQKEDLYAKLSELINYAVTPKFVDISLGSSELIDLAVEIWRMEQRLGKCLPSLSENQCKGLEISIEKLKRYIAKSDIELLDYTNQKFNDGLNLDVLSVEIDPSLTAPIVKETIEPTVLCKGQVVRKAKIILLSNH